MSDHHRFRFHWRADGQTCDTVIEAADYPMACYRLAQFQWDLWKIGRGGKVPADFEIDLTKPERVE